MKKLTYILFISLLSSSLVFAQRKAKTPLDLLKKIHKYATQKKYDKLNSYLYQGTIIKGPSKKINGKTMAELILGGIKDPQVSSDFSYSSEALKTIIDQHSDRLIPITEKLRNELFTSNQGSFSQFTDLKKIADNRPKDLYIFVYGGVHMLMAKIDKGFQLVFWDGLRRFGKNSGSSEPSTEGGK